MRINLDLKKLGEQRGSRLIFQSARTAMLHWEFLQLRARGGDRGRYYLLYEEERKIFAKNIFSVGRICYHSDFFIS